MPAATPANACTDRRLRWVVPAVLAGVLALGLGPGLGGDFVWDDQYLLMGVHKSPLQALTSDFWVGQNSAAGQTAMYRPVVSLYLSLGRSLFGGPLGFHLFNWGLHLAVSLLAVRWLSRRLGGGDPEVWAALLAVGLLAIHPTRPESVSFISGATDLFLALFLLLAAEAFASRRFAWATGPLLALAFLSKESGIVGPLLLGLDALLAGQSKVAGKRLALRLGIAAAFVAGAYALHQALIPILTNPIGPLGPALVRVLVSLGAYARIVVLPWPSSSYTMPETATGTEFPVTLFVAGLAVVALVVAVSVLAFRRPRLRPALADLAWVLLPLGPVINLVPLGYVNFVSERFLYVPLLGVSALLGRGFLGLMWKPAERRGTIILAWVAALAFSVPCALRARTFQSDEARIRHEVELAPDNGDLLLEYGRALWRQDDAAGALEALERAHGRSFRSLKLQASAAEWACIKLATAQDQDEAGLKRLARFFDQLASAPNNTVALLQAEHSTLSVRVTPLTRSAFHSNHVLLSHQALAHLRSGDFAGAIAPFREALALRAEPGFARGLAISLAIEGRTREALGELDEALRRASFPPLLELRRRLAAVEARGALPDAEPARSLEQATRMLQLGVAVPAHRRLEKLLADWPQDPRVALAASQAARAAGAPERAQAILDEARARMPGSVELASPAAP